MTHCCLQTARLSISLNPLVTVLVLYLLAEALDASVLVQPFGCWACQLPAAVCLADSLTVPRLQKDYFTVHCSRSEGARSVGARSVVFVGCC